MSKDDKNEILQDSRDKCVLKFAEIFEDDDLCYELEESIYEYARHRENPKRIYLNKCISLYSNLNHQSYIKNPSLLTRILSGETKVSELPHMTPQELFPENWKTLIEKKDAKDDFLYTGKYQSFTEEYKCGRCKQKKCSTYSLQIRCIDEPETVYVTCINCGNKWHF